MLKTRRPFGAAYLLPLTLAAWSGAAAAQQPVQDANTVGAPQLRDFTLPGTRTTPPAQVPPPAAAAPAPRAAAPATSTAPARQTPAAGRRPARPAPQREAARPRTAPAPAPRSAPASAAPQAPPAVQPQAQPVAAPPAAPTQPQPQPLTVPPAVVPAPQAGPAPVQQGGGSFPWLWLLGALVVLGGGALLLLRRRRAAGERDVRDRGALAGSLATAQWLPAEEPAPQPVAVEPAIAPAPAAAAAKRAVLEVDIRPERASAMEDGTLVQYSLTLTNTGEAAAGNIRIDGRMFNASADGEVDGFFAGPIHEMSGSPNVFLQPGESLTLQGQIGMTREEQHGIEVQGRVIFVPMVAMNVAYEWEGGSGRSSASWLVGRTPSSPEAKMGAFRLDLGPRIYRQVDRREAKKALV